MFKYAPGFGYVTADPTVDVDHLKRIDTVIKGGRVVDRSALDLPVNRRSTP